MIKMIIISSANCTLISDTPIIPYLKALPMYNKGFAFETICQVFDNNSTDSSRKILKENNIKFYKVLKLGKGNVIKEVLKSMSLYLGMEIPNWPPDNIAELSKKLEESI